MIEDIKNLKQEDDDSDWDFDFSQYDEEKQDSEIDCESHFDKKRPAFTGFKSKYSTGEMSLSLLVEIKRNIAKYSIEVGSRQADINVLWKYYALLDEFWEQFRNTFGQFINDKITGIKRNCRLRLERCNKKNIPPTIKDYNALLFLRSKLYRLFQNANFGYEVERVSRNSFVKSKRKITQ